MPPAPKKTDPVAETVDPAAVTPAEAAAGEAQSTDIVLTFRGQKFTITRGILESARFRLAFASNQLDKLLFELLGPADADRFILLSQRGESLEAVATEFFEAFNEATQSGNS